MATVDLKKLTKLYEKRMRALEALPFIRMTESPAITEVWEVLPALIRRVERYEIALNEIANDCREYQDGRGLPKEVGMMVHKLHSIAGRAITLKEEPDSVG